MVASAGQRPGLDAAEEVFVSLLQRSAPEEATFLFVDPDELGQIFDPEVGEGEDTVVTNAEHPDDAVLNVHFTGDVAHPLFVLAKIGGNTGDGGDVMNLVDVHRPTEKSIRGGVLKRRADQRSM